MENEKHEVKVEKERKQFEERKEKEILKMKQVRIVLTFLPERAVDSYRRIDRQCCLFRNT